MNLLQKLFGNNSEKLIKKIQPLVTKINSFEQHFSEFSDDALQQKTLEFKEMLETGKTLDDILPEAFAVVREASKRVLNMRHFDVQLLGGIVLHQGKISEMKTGEGKTLVATLPAYLNALTGKGVQIVTVNDYLARRDATEMGPLYEFLGMTCSFIVEGQSPTERKQCYQADIVYATNNHLGFDYLRDNMAPNAEGMVQRGLHFAIVDEVDSILIDEARTPLIISAAAEESTNKYIVYSRLIPKLQKDLHYTIDEKSNSVLLNETGIAKMEELLGVDNIYTDAGFTEVHHIEQALKASVLFKRDVDYVIKDGEIIIVDEFTGRLMPGRRYSDGLHQAIEAKENVEVKRESKTLASITFQNYFRLYEKLAGMTGTAETESEEFYQIYGLEVIVIPTNQPITRNDKRDRIYKSTKGKFIAIAREVKEKYKSGQPVLIGTASIETSELLSKLFEREGIQHEVLNAKQHEREAEIIARAGQHGAVTIATNMAGRGTDIKLGVNVRELGGLCIIGSERHEARRIDNQLRGRSGRQGDPGETQFFVSMEDDLMRIFGGDRIKTMMNVLKVPEDMPIENAIISKSIESAQKRIEGSNFDVRKHVLEYDDVLSKQREAIYRRRRFILQHENVSEKIQEMFSKEAEGIIDGNLDMESHQYNIEEIMGILKRMTKKDITLEMDSRDALVREIAVIFEKIYEDKRKSAPSIEVFDRIEKAIYLRSIDALWMEHIDSMSNLRNDVALYGYGQRNPLSEYKKESFEMYQKLIANIQTSTLQTLFHIQFEQAPVIKQEEAPRNLQTNTQEIENALTYKYTNSSDPDNRQTINDQRPSFPQRHSAELHTQRKVENITGRNDPCHCGSGKKYKKCHGANVGEV